MQSSIRFAGLLAACLLLFSGATSVALSQGSNPPEVPEIHQRVTDLTGTLTSDQINELSQKLAQFERETSNQIAVLMIPTVGNGSVEDFSMRVAEKNKFGKKGRDNGVLLFIAKDDHWIRIEVGYGLEGALTDARSDQIIRHEMFPRFRGGDFYGGIDAGVNAIIAATKGEYKGNNNQQNGRQNIPGAAIFLLIFLFFFISRILRGARRTYLGSGRYYRGGGWWGGGFGGFGGGGFGGGGFGGGGFSGGGGGFGGGGASGRW